MGRSFLNGFKTGLAGLLLGNGQELDVTAVTSGQENEVARIINGIPVFAPAPCIIPVCGGVDSVLGADRFFSFLRFQDTYSNSPEGVLGDILGCGDILTGFSFWMPTPATGDQFFRVYKNGVYTGVEFRIPSGSYNVDYDSYVVPVDYGDRIALLHTSESVGDLFSISWGFTIRLTSNI